MARSGVYYGGEELSPRMKTLLDAVNAKICNSAKEFNLLIDAFVQRIPPDAVILLQKKIALEGLNSIVFKTPVDTGRCRGSWIVSIGDLPEGETDGALDKAGDATVQRGRKAIEMIDKITVAWIATNLIYAPVLENGHSKQAPAGMVAVTIEQLKAMFP